jgi:predicted ArsR family transcriptional regulator
MLAILGRLAMDEETRISKSVDEFIAREMDTVPHLEALLLLWSSRPKLWSVDDMAALLYISGGEARGILQNLVRRKLVRAERGQVEAYGYISEPGERDELIAAVERTYGRELIRISRMIHAKASPGVRDFADAFRFTKDKEKE